MRLLSRDFSIKEKVMLLILILVIIGLLYYQFVYTPVTDTIKRCESAKESLSVELEALQVRIEQLEKMKNEIDNVYLNGTLKRMPSYNNSKNITKLLNDVLGDMDYTITFSEVTREADQIRRNISIQFKAPDEATVRQVMARLVDCDYRCLIGDVSCNAVYVARNGYVYDYWYDGIKAAITVTFFETMVGGTADAGLPTD